VVDVGEVYRQKEAQFTLILTKAGSDVERERAMAMARSFSQRLPVALENCRATAAAWWCSRAPWPARRRARWT
jgi:hypothetical protein